MTQELNKLSITEASKGLAEKKFSAKELTEAHINQIEKFDKKINSFITKAFEKARVSADLSDRNISAGKIRKLEGIPLAIKDLFCTKGIKTTAGSKMLENFVPPYESTVTGKLLDSGAVFLGKVSCDEFAMGSSNMTSYFGNVINPWKNSSDTSRDLVPGGSSGGSSASVSAFMAMGATGTDTGGSIRQPAAFTGLVGIKPTYGRCSRFGVIAFASSLDCPGVFARNVDDSALLLEVIAGYDKNDSTSANVEVPNFSQYKNTENNTVKGLRIGVPIDLMELSGVSSEVIEMWHKTINILRSEGADIVNITLPNSKYGLPVYYILASAEASSNLSRYDGVRYSHRVDADDINELYELSRADGFGLEVKRRIIIGTYVLSSDAIEAYYIKAQKVRRLMLNDFKAAFNKVDTILIPSAPSEAFFTDVKQDNPVEMYLNDIFTIPVSLAGLPSMSVPVSLSKNNLPLCMQVISRHFDEMTMIKVGSAIERNINTKFTPEGY